MVQIGATLSPTDHRRIEMNEIYVYGVPIVAFLVGLVVSRYKLAGEIIKLGDYAWGFEHLLTSLQKLVVDFRRASADGQYTQEEIEKLIGDIEELYNQMNKAKEAWEAQ
jgi:hypothetical protein